MNTRVQGVLPVYAIFGCVSDFAHNFSPMTPTTLNCGATVRFNLSDNVLYITIDDIGQAGFEVDAYGNFRVVDPPANCEGGRYSRLRSLEQR